jgi:hypothetical protein
MSISRFSLRDKATLRLLKLYFYIADVAEWSKGVVHKAKRLVLQCINGASSNPVEGRTKMCQLQDLIIALFGLIFRRIYTHIYIYIVTKYVYKIYLCVCPIEIIYCKEITFSFEQIPVTVTVHCK